MPTSKASSTTVSWQRLILAFVAAHPDRPLKPRALARELRIPNPDYTIFRQIVHDLLEHGTLVLGPGRTLRLPAQTGQVVGTFRANRRGFGFIDRPGQPDVYVARHHTAGAREGDTVAVRLLKRRGAAPGPRAEVMRIIERATQRWVGKLERLGSTWIVRPHGRDPLPPFRIADPSAERARPGDLVLVEPDERARDARTTRGIIIERLGDAQGARAWILGVIRRHAIPDRFPPAALRAARLAAAGFNPDDLEGREDLRDLLSITIDPPDARDFDDAISVEHVTDDRVRLGVHIADVAHFVPQDGPVDLEARQRGTSVYFPGLVVPMLPEPLSSHACSLQPGEPRLTKSVFLTYDGAARVVEARLTHSVICSAARLTYQQASAALEGRRAAVTLPIAALLKRADALARRIQRRRLKNGMLVLTLPEVEIRLDERGRVVDAGPSDTSFSHTIIEMFMVEANEAVSRALTQAGFEHLRRVHPPPEPVANAGLAQLAPILGHRLPTSLNRETISKLLDAVRGRPEETAVNLVLLRALAQAAYSPGREGHFALASTDYCHFTSPIRRYPDLTVHRLFDAHLSAKGGKRRKRRAAAVPPTAELAELGRRASAAERRAQQAEREADNLLLLLLMQTKVGEVFEGVITGVAAFGAFVQIQPYLAEGVLRLGDLGPDDWDFDRRAGVLVGRRTRRVVHLGQPLRVRVAAVDDAHQELVLVPAHAGLIGMAGGDRVGVMGMRNRQQRARGGRRA